MKLNFDNQINTLLEQYIVDEQFSSVQYVPTTRYDITDIRGFLHKLKDSVHKLTSLDGSLYEINLIPEFVKNNNNVKLPIPKPGQKLTDQDVKAQIHQAIFNYVFNNHAISTILDFPAILRILKNRGVIQTELMTVDINTIFNLIKEEPQLNQFIKETPNVIASTTNKTRNTPSRSDNSPSTTKDSQTQQPGRIRKGLRHTGKYIAHDLPGSLYNRAARIPTIRG